MSFFFLKSLIPTSNTCNYLNISFSGNILGIFWEDIGNVFRIEIVKKWEYFGRILGILWEFCGNEMCW
jgi:hypothetical protein